MSVEKGWDEVWVAVKFQTNLEIAGSLRNLFRGSLGIENLAVEHCLDEGPVMGYRIQINSNANDLCPGVRR